MLFAREGARVAVADVLADFGAETVRLIEGEGGEAIFIPTDVAREDQVKRMVEQTASRRGRVDVLFNNAGYAQVRRPGEWARAPRPCRPHPAGQPPGASPLQGLTIKAVAVATPRPSKL